MPDDLHVTTGSLGAPEPVAGRQTAEARPDDLVELVMSCATALDGMPDASTSARLALVADRVAAVVQAPTWCVSLAHADRLYEVSAGSSAGAAPDERNEQPLTSVPITLGSARHWASEGGAFYADESVGDEVARRELAVRGHRAVMGAGGYDQDGRSWLVELFADATTHRLEPVTPVLTAMVQSALCFPRDAVVPRPVEPAVRAVLRRPWRLAGECGTTALDAAG